MRVGFELRRAALRARFPDATDGALEAMFTKWLAYDE